MGVPDRFFGGLSAREHSVASSVFPSEPGSSPVLLVAVLFLFLAAMGEL